MGGRNPVVICNYWSVIWLYTPNKDPSFARMIKVWGEVAKRIDQCNQCFEVQERFSLKRYTYQKNNKRAVPLVSGPPLYD